MSGTVCVGCEHVMVRHCPGCHREMYAPVVWDFSHGAVTCGCGHRIEPRLRLEMTVPADEWAVR